jgi:hypothetical protein
MNYRTRRMLNYRDATADGLLWGYWGQKSPWFRQFMLDMEQHREENYDLLLKSNKMTITSQQYLTILRAILSAAGGALVTSGVISDSTLQAVIGIAMPLGSIVWGLFVHSPTQVVKEAEVVKAKGLA